MEKIITILALGGNIGNVPETFNKALKLLETGGLEILKVASNMTSKPLNCPPDTPDFINSALLAYWKDSPEKLLELCQQTEIQCGRPKDHLSYVSRTLDIDIIIFGDLIYNTDKLIIPHPQASKRFFVVKPIFEIKPDLIFPDTGAILSVLFHDLLKKEQ